MQIRFHINSKYKTPEIVICNVEMNESIQHLADTISRAVSKTITGYTENGTALLPVADIIRVYAERQRVIAQTKEGTYILRYKLYELEELLSDSDFVRISKSELVNIHSINKLDTSMTGTIHIYLQGNINTYVSRRNVANIKKEIEKRGDRL